MLDVQKTHKTGFYFVSVILGARTIKGREEERKADEQAKEICEYIYDQELPC